MFVSELYLREFRGIKDCQKPLKISKFTVLVGRNNTRKSAILEALSLLPHPYLPCVPTLEMKKAFTTGLFKKYELLCLLHSKDSLVYGYAGEFYARCLLNTIGKWELTKSDQELRVTVDGQELYIDTQYARLSEIFGMSKNELEKLVVFIPSDTQIIKEIDKTLENIKI